MLDRMFLSAGSAETLYVEDVFSTWLYTGNSSTQTITNGIDLAGKGGLVWIKSRSNALENELVDTARAKSGTYYDMLRSNNTAAVTEGDVTAFNSNGFTVGNNTSYANNSPYTYASWTFRKAPKFFDVVTWTGNGANRTISHNLGVAPGCIIVKRTDTTADWQVYHRSNANTEYMVLNTTAAKATGTTRWNSTTPTATEFTVGTDTTVNASGGTYVAYLFAHDATAGGIIQCGSFTTDASGNAPPVDLGWEPQWILWKSSSATGNWQLLDTMRGWNNSGTNDNKGLYADLTNAEGNVFQGAGPNPTGFTMIGNPSRTNIYIAIRRGPMKTPTVGTSVFFPSVTTSSTTTGTVITTGFPVDMQMLSYRAFSESSNTTVVDRLRGVSSTTTELGRNIVTSSTGAETTARLSTRNFGNTGYQVSSYYAGSSVITQNFRRAPGFFDVVCYTGNDATNRSVPHNLGVTPELVIVKSRFISGWMVYSSSANAELVLETSDAKKGALYDFYTPGNTATTFGIAPSSLSGAANINVGGIGYVAYLFASCPGVSKVGSYTGNGSSQTINCGFSSGARFFLVKRTDSTGDWWVYDSARGIVAAADPALRLNSTAPEVTSADAVDTDSTGIIVNQEATCNINVNGGTYIYLAIA